MSFRSSMVINNLQTGDNLGAQVKVRNSLTVVAVVVRQ